MEFNVNIRNTALASTMFCILVSTPLLAVDEDYFIPYTDNYGYEYDPETGTYVQTKPTATVTPQPTSQTGQQTATESSKASLTAQPNPDQSETVNDTDSISIQLPVLIGALVGILVISFALARTFKKQDA
ncbi:MAG: hypothetical protein HKN08_06770 [Gammaproteobacteria bacterium]|nr:hypothetical protein [Gammaproteobacteria bacterium]